MLDKIDRKILLELQSNGRVTNVELARKVNLSEAACLQRVRKLIENNYVLKFSSLLNPGLLDASTIVLAALKLECTSLSVLEDFKKRVSVLPEIQECYFIGGSFDYFVKIRVKDMQAYKSKVMKSILSFPGVREMQTYSVLEEVKSTTDLAVM